MRCINALIAMTIAMAAVDRCAHAENRLINGDFEQAGAAGSSECGPGWVTDGGLTIVGAEGWWRDARPLNGSKAIGVAARNLIDQGRAEQNVEVKPGTYKVTATGHVWIEDTLCGDGISSYLEVRLLVDGRIVRARKFEPDVQKKWFTVRYDWRGHANAGVRLELIARADGRGPKEAWGIVVTDCWTMDVVANPPAEPNLFVNGDFEQAGAVGTQDVGPGWKIGKTARVLTFGTVDEQAGSFGPYDGSKAIGLICHSVDKGGLLEQTAMIEPGFYTLTLTGHLYLWDTFGGDSMNSHCEVWFNVDGKPVQYKRVYCTSPMGPNESWGDLCWTWTGRVEHSAGVSLNMQARGYGPEMSWGLVATDGWRLTADPATSEDNLLINGDFEQAGEIGTKDGGPGWITDPKENMRVWADIDVRTPMEEGHPPSVHPNFAPRSGKKAMAVVTHAKDDSGTLEQTVKLAPGDYDLDMCGYLWLLNNFGGDQDNAYTEVWLRVDGKQVRYKRSYTGDEGFPDNWWGRLHWQWSGHVEKEVTVLIDAQARGRGPEKSWAVCGVDDWSLRANKVGQRVAPQVKVDGQTTMDPTQLHARWTYADVRPDATEYQYAIGTTPGGVDVVDWIDVGQMTEITRAGLSLEAGKTYYLSVKATAGNEVWSPPGASDGVQMTRR